ncbi:MAG TPA: DUF4340 domain-containing protein [Verrucomicrobiae bacterium]|nr:DUF4340 domain-containing protein [Verrucomicrobiae bacterium]
MNSKSTWVWLGIAATLFAVIVIVEKFGPKPPPGPMPLIPGFQAGLVTSVQLGLSDQPSEIQAVRTNGTWQLIKPITYPAQKVSIETLLVVLQQLAPAMVIPGSEVRQRKNADQEFGFAKPQAALTLKTRDKVVPILIGSRTAPGDQVYVHIAGLEGVYLVDAALLKLLPRNVDDWRDSAFADLQPLRFDHINISNTVASLEVQRDLTNLLWRLTRPMSARADSQRINLALQKLNTARVTRFVTDDAKADLESYGLNAPELELTLSQETNVVATYQFGRSPTNDSTQVFARRLGLSTIVTVPNDLLELWRGPLNQFRDPHVVTFSRPVDRIDLTGTEPFTLQRVSSNSWQIAQATLPVDATLVEGLLTTLGNLSVEQFKDSITESDLPRYGLVNPYRQVQVSSVVTNGSGSTNLVMATLSFGTTNGEYFVRRSDENPVYAIAASQAQQIPVYPWQLRERRIWNFNENDVVRLFFKQPDQQVELRRAGTNTWVLPPSVPGILNSFGIEETVHRLGELTATGWIGHGEGLREKFGFGTNNVTLTLELKDRTKYVVEFGGASADSYPYAVVTLDGEPWYFEFPLALHEYMLFYLKPQAGSK